MPTPDPADETAEVEHASGGGFWHWVGQVVPTTLVVVGIIALAGPGGFLGFFVAPLWMLVAGVMMLRTDMVAEPAA
jgi:hypothetical protein